jgi:pilus assembly protein CpaE
LRAALASAGIDDPAILLEYPPPGVIAGLAAQHGRNLCLIELAADEEQALRTIGEAASVVPVVGIIPRQDADVILRALRHGAREFLPEPTAEQLRALLERLDHARAPAEAQPAGKVYCVVPGKPGSGASTVAVHLAAERHAGGGSVLLVDADVVTGGVGFLLKLKSEYHLDDVLRDWKRMDEDLWSRLVTPWSGVDVVLAPEEPATRCPVAPELAKELAAFWRKRYQTVIVDAPDVRAAAESGLAEAADEIVVVTTNEIGALHATRRGIEYLEQTASARGRLRLVLNRYHPSTGLKREDVRTALRVEPFALLTNDYELLQAAILEGKAASAKSRFSAGVRILSDALAGTCPLPKAGSWLGRLMQRK